MVLNRIRRYPSLVAFFDYVQNTYILPNSNFPPHRWNLFHRNMDTRTNNMVESFHKHLNQKVSVRHPSIWTFIMHLKDLHASTQINIRNANAGVLRPPRRRKWRNVEHNLISLKDQYNAGRRNLNSYWTASMYYVKNFLK